jgi:CHASE2 domain-containing sensor protein
VADIYAGQEVVPLAAKELDINFSPVFFHVVPPDSVLACRDLIEDRVVLFGAMKEEADMHYTPQGKIAGVKLLAYAVETMLRQNQIRHVPEWLTVVVSLLIVFVTVVMLKWYGKIRQKKTLMRVLLSASLFKGLFLFVWLSILVWAAFILFSRYQVSINLTYALAAVAFIGMANDLYDTLKDLITFKKEKKQ